jgi:hypothetical protein
MLVLIERLNTGRVKLTEMAIRLFQQFSFFPTLLKNVIMSKMAAIKYLVGKTLMRNGKSEDPELVTPDATGKKNSDNNVSKNIDLKKSMFDFVNALKDVSRNITGQKFVEAAESMLDQQMRYNNILATRLAEALVDIESLKDQLRKLEQKI